MFELSMLMGSLILTILFTKYLFYTADVRYQNKTYSETLSFAYDNRTIGVKRVEKRTSPRGRRKEELK